MRPPPIKQGNIQLASPRFWIWRRPDRRLGHVEASAAFLKAALVGNGPQDAQADRGEGQISHGMTRGALLH